MARRWRLALLSGAVGPLMAAAQTPCAGAVITATINGATVSWTENGSDASTCAPMGCGTYTAVTDSWVSGALPSTATVTWVEACSTSESTPASTAATTSSYEYSSTTSSAPPYTASIVSSTSSTTASQYQSSLTSSLATSMSSAAALTLDSTSSSLPSTSEDSTSSSTELAATSTSSVVGSSSSYLNASVLTSTQSQLEAMEPTTSSAFFLSSVASAGTASSSFATGQPSVAGSLANSSYSESSSASSASALSSSSTSSSESQAGTSTESYTSLQPTSSFSTSANGTAVLPTTTSASSSIISVSQSASDRPLQESSESASSSEANTSSIDLSSSASSSSGYTSTFFPFSPSSNTSTASVPGTGVSSSSVVNQGTSPITYTLTSTAGGISFVITMTSTVVVDATASSSESTTGLDSASETFATTTVSGFSFPPQSSSESSSTPSTNSSDTFATTAVSGFTMPSEVPGTNSSSSSVSSRAFTSFSNSTTISATSGSPIISAKPGSAPGSTSGYFPNSTTSSIIPTSLSGAPSNFSVPASISFATVPSYSGPLTTYTSDGSSLGIYYLTPGAPAPTSCVTCWTATSAGNDLLVCAYPVLASFSQPYSVSGTACPLGFDLAVGVTTINGQELALGLMPTSSSIGTSCYASLTFIDGTSYFLAGEGQVQFTTPAGFDFYGTPTSTLTTTPTGIVTSFDASTTIKGVKTIGDDEIEVEVTPTPCHKDGCAKHPSPVVEFIKFPFPIPVKWLLNLPDFPKIQFPKLPCIKIFFIHLGDCPKPKVVDPPEHPPTASPSPTSTTSEECEDPLTITNCFDAVTVYPPKGTSTIGYSTTSAQTCSKITTCTGIPKTSMSTTTMSTQSCPTPQTITKCFDAVTVSPYNETTSGTTTSGFSTTSSQTCSLVTTCSGYPTTTMSITTLTGGSCPIGITVSPDDDQGEDGISTSTCANTATTTVTDIVSLCSTFNVTSGTVSGPSTTCFTSSSMTVTGTCIQPTTTSTIVNNGSCNFGNMPSFGAISLTSILANVTDALPTIGTSSSGESLTCITNLTAAGLSAITNAYNETITGYSSGYCMFTGPASASATTTSSMNISSMITSAPTTSTSSSLQPLTTANVDQGNLVCNRRLDSDNQWYWFSPAQATLAINNFCSKLVAEDPPMVFGPGFCNQYYQDYPQSDGMAGYIHVAMQWVPGDNGCPTTVFDSNLNSTCVERLTDILNNCDLEDPMNNGQYVELWKQGGTFYRDCMNWYLEGPNITVSSTTYGSSDCGSTTPASLTATTTSNPFVCTYGADPDVYTASGGYCECPDGSLYPTSPATSPVSTPCGYTTQPTATTDLGSTISPSISVTPYPTVYTTGGASAYCYAYETGRGIFSSSDGASAISQFCRSDISVPPSTTTTYAATYTADFVAITVGVSWAEDQDGCSNQAGIDWAGCGDGSADGDCTAYNVCYANYDTILSTSECTEGDGLTWGGAYVFSDPRGCLLLTIGSDED